MSNVFGESDVAPTESKTTCTAGNFAHGSQNPSGIRCSPGSGSVGEGAMPQFQRARCRGVTQSHSTQETGRQRRRAAARGVGGGKGTDEENTEQPLLVRIQRRNADGMPFVPRSRGLPGVRQAARKDRKLRFTNLLHHLTPQLLRASFFALKKRPQPGVNGETWRDYKVDLDRRIVDLHGRNPSRSIPGQAFQADVHPQA